MKKQLILVLMLSVSFSVIATEDTTKATDVTSKKSAWMTKDLGLTPEQQTQVDAIFEQHHQKSKALHDETTAQIKAVLTPEQLVKFKEKHDKMKMHHKDKAMGDAKKQ